MQIKPIKPIIEALVAYVKLSYPDTEYDDSGVANSSSFPVSVISNLTIDDDERVSFTVNHWAKSEAQSADALQALCDGMKACISQKIITFSGGVFLPWFDSEVSEVEEPDYVHRVQIFSGSIYGG